MPVSTSNTYGKIAISDEAIVKVAEHATLDCYGIVELVSKNFKDTFSKILRKSSVKGVSIETAGDRISIDLCVIIKFGVSISAVADSLKNAVKYEVEKFTGMIVDTVNVNIMGVKL